MNGDGPTMLRMWGRAEDECIVGLFRTINPGVGTFIQPHPTNTYLLLSIPFLVCELCLNRPVQPVIDG